MGSQSRILSFVFCFVSSLSYSVTAVMSMVRVREVLHRKPKILTLCGLEFWILMADGGCSHLGFSVVIIIVSSCAPYLLSWRVVLLNLVCLSF